MTLKLHRLEAKQKHVFHKSAEFVGWNLEGVVTGQAPNHVLHVVSVIHFYVTEVWS